MNAHGVRSIALSAWLEGLIMLSLFLGPVMPVTAGPVADYGDAPDPPYPSLYNTASTLYPGRRGPHHLDVSKEWIGTALTSTTTLEADALVPNLDFDDGAVQVRRAWVADTATQIGFATVPVTIAPGTNGDVRYLNVVADFNRDGAWAAYNYGGATLQEEWIAKNVALIFAATETSVVASSPFVWLDDAISTTIPIWVRVTLTTEPVDPSVFGGGIPGWDGSGPNSGFARGETEDWQIIPQNLAPQPLPNGFDPGQGGPPLGCGPGPDCGPGPSTGPDAGPGNGNPPVGGIENSPVPDIGQRPAECGPTSAANSLYYLGAANGFSQLLPGSPQNPWSLIDMLKGYMSWNLDWGVTGSNFVSGKQAIAGALGLPIETHYQGQGQIPDANWLMSQLDAGADVEVAMRFTDGGGGGHMVTAVGYTRYANGDVVLKIHDPDDGIDGDVRFRLGTQGGYPSLLDYDRLNRIEWVVSEHVPQIDVPGAGRPSVATWVAPAYPNPANPSATIKFSLGEPGKVTLTIFDASGRQIRRLVNEWKSAGEYSVLWDGRDNHGDMVRSGVFFYRFAVSGFESEKKLVILQ
jgi:hypothetical protein